MRFFGIAALLGLSAWWLFDRDSLRVHASEARTLTASWYGRECQGRFQANGKPFNPDRFTAASWDYPLGTILSVSVPGRAGGIAVVVSDRGPNKRLLKSRQLDLSRSAFLALAPLEKGLIRVTVEVL